MPRTELTGPTSFLLSPSGADTGPGTSSPWQTLDYAINRIWRDHDARGFPIAVELYPGESSPGVYDQPAVYSGGWAAHGPMIGGDKRQPVTIVGKETMWTPTWNVGGPRLVTVKGMGMLTGGAQVAMRNYSLDSINPASPEIGGVSCDDGGTHAYAEYMRFCTFRDFYMQAGTGSRCKLGGAANWFTSGGARCAFGFVGPGAQFQYYGGGTMMYFNESAAGVISPGIGNPDYPIGFFYGTERSWLNCGGFGHNGGNVGGPRLVMNLGAAGYGTMPAASMPGNAAPQIDSASGCWYAA